MKRIKFKQIDVFTTTPFCGNPTAVIFEDHNLKTEEMQAISREMNLSETAFVLPPTVPEADYRARFFTPRNEHPFAGHPTIGTAFALLTTGHAFGKDFPDVIRQECGVGVVPITVEQTTSGQFFSMTQGRPQWIKAAINREQCATILGCKKSDVMDLPPEVVSTGMKWLIIGLTNLEAAKALKPNISLIIETCQNVGSVGITVFCLETEQKDCDVHIRTFAPGEGVLEDPVCGSGNGSVGAYFAKHGIMTGKTFAYIAEQGLELHRPGLISVKAQQNEDGYWSIKVGGQAVEVLQGELTF